MAQTDQRCLGQLVGEERRERAADVRLDPLHEIGDARLVENRTQLLGERLTVARHGCDEHRRQAGLGTLQERVADERRAEEVDSEHRRTIAEVRGDPDDVGEGADRALRRRTLGERFDRFLVGDVTFHA